MITVLILIICSIFQVLISFSFTKFPNFIKCFITLLYYQFFFMNFIFFYVMLEFFQFILQFAILLHNYYAILPDIQRKL
jgi:hypothetical protein